MYTRQQLVNMNIEQLVNIILNMQEVAERGKNITAYYDRKHSNSKFSDITPEQVAKLHEDGYSLTEIKNKIDKMFKSNNILDKDGNIKEISIQTLMYKIKKYEKETGKSIYKPGNKGRKKKNATLFD